LIESQLQGRHKWRLFPTISSLFLAYLILLFRLLFFLEGLGDLLRPRLVADDDYAIQFLSLVRVCGLP
jgi:hypothetical protein